MERAPFQLAGAAGALTSKTATTIAMKFLFTSISKDVRRKVGARASPAGQRAPSFTRIEIDDLGGVRLVTRFIAIESP
jgi:hypothetical protein